MVFVPGKKMSNEEKINWTKSVEMRDTCWRNSLNSNVGMENKKIGYDYDLHISNSY